jgi:8-oxo-dGTP pyrophosphatase MutT (NUDIX family)
MDELCAQWGPLPVVPVRLEVASPFLTGENQRLVGDGRRAEICYVMYRGAAVTDLLLHIKRYYPTGAFRLPTGGIQAGEPVMATLAREIEEETGLVVGARADQVRVERCLGVIDYELVHAEPAQSARFATYIFLVHMPDGAVLVPQDADEEITGWVWRRPDELAAAAEYLARIGEQHAVWGDWGRFRAVSHRHVAAHLCARS